jgi:SAM-dependent methyltransferase
MPVLRLAARKTALRPASDPAAGCVVCGAPVIAYLEADLFRCASCGYVGSTLAPGATAEGARLDEALRRRALEGLRRANARAILDVLALHRPLAGTRLCDVGCGYGWFLDEARRRGAQALGIEPDRPVAQAALDAGHDVRVGEFPAALSAGERFDVLSFNDVLEHQNGIELMLAASRRHLLPGGLLAIALPTSGGAVYRTTCVLRRMGVRGPLDRLWQRGYPSPHRHYFDAVNLRRLVERFGLSLVHQQPLPAWQVAGLWTRLRMDGARPAWQAALAWSALVGASPLLRALPSDILLHVYRAR